jgi:hypothetical protein
LLKKGEEKRKKNIAIYIKKKRKKEREVREVIPLLLWTFATTMANAY